MNDATVSPVAFLKSCGIVDLQVPKLWVHGLYVSQSDLDLLKRTRTVFGGYPYSQVQFGFLHEHDNGAHQV